jgi:predicted enzyme related to lactoylglutathione lyase
MGNRFCHLELTTHDLAGAREFYRQMFEWEIQAFPNPGKPYFMINTGQEPQGGMMDLPMPGVPTAWSVYVAVDDLDAACAKLERLGGKIMMSRTEVPGAGWFAFASDPQGAYFGLWQNLA